MRLLDFVIAWWNKKHYEQMGCALIGTQTYEAACEVVKAFEATNRNEAAMQGREWGAYRFQPIYDKADNRPMKDKYHEAAYGCKTRRM